MAELNGPRLAPHSRGPARQLVIFLHGYGADGNDLIELGRVWQAALPDAAFVSPHAPEPCGQAPVGRQWFSLTFRDPDERWVGVNKAAPTLERFIEAELGKDLVAKQLCTLRPQSNCLGNDLCVVGRSAALAARHPSTENFFAQIAPRGEL